jgi:hypothetical protein
VVLSGGDYARFVPKSGYINVLDFKTPKHLADYLLYLDRNQIAYNEYFKWKKYVNFRKAREIVKAGYLCEMCIQLHLEEQTKLVKRRQLTPIKELFGMEENCYGANIQQLTVFDYLKGFNLRQMYHLSP